MQYIYLNINIYIYLFILATNTNSVHSIMSRKEKIHITGILFKEFLGKLPVAIFSVNKFYLFTIYFIKVESAPLLITGYGKNGALLTIRLNTC